MKWFPVLGEGYQVPWAMIEPHEPQALDNHRQTLKRLAERGGLCWAELLCVLEGRRWNFGSELADEAAKPRVLALVNAYHQANMTAARRETDAAIWEQGYGAGSRDACCHASEPTPNPYRDTPVSTDTKPAADPDRT